MVGTTLNELRTRIETLASDGGEYVVRCARTGERPVPVDGLHFDDRTGAQEAARAAEQYRAVLRRYDPQVRYYDPIVCEDTESVGSASGPRPRSISDSRDPTTEGLSEPVVTGSEPGRRRLVEFCHSAATAVFETLSEEGYGEVESAVMDAYVEVAERRPDHDDLCLCLLERMALELDARVQPEDQAAVVARAAGLLAPADTADRPVSATLATLEDRGLLGGYTQSPWFVERRDGTRYIVVQISEYALAPRDGRLPVLPIALELYRHRPNWLPSSLRVGDVDDGWQLTLTPADETAPSGLATAVIES